MKNELEVKGLTAAKRYLKIRGYEILDCEIPEGIDIVAKDLNNEALAFINIKTHDGSSDEFPKEIIPSKKEIHELETKAFKYFKRVPSKDSNLPIRFDNLTIVRLNNNKALVRHYVNITG